MKEEMMQRFLNLIEKTGDKIVITDPAGERPYVMMSLDHYEKLVGTGVAPLQETVETKSPFSRPAAKKEALPVKKEVPLWRAQLNREIAADAPIREFSARKGAAPAKAGVLREIPAVVDTFQMEAEGEEQFFLEPLE